MNSLLAALQTEEFGVELYGLASTEATYRGHARQDAVVALRKGYKTGAVTEAEIRAFVDDLLRPLKPGVKLEHEEALGGIAVALEPFDDAFAAEYINDLAALNCSEMGRACRVARLCKRNRDGN